MSNYNPFDILGEEERAPAAQKSKKVVDAPANKAKAEPALIEKEDHSRHGARRERGGRGAARGGAAGAGGRPPRRQFDRQSASGFAPGPKRGDAGAYNWGQAGSEVVEQQAQPEGEAVVAEGEAAVAAEGAEHKQPEEEEDVGISVAQAMKLMAAKRVEDDDKVNLRQAGEGEEDDGQELRAFQREEAAGDILGGKAGKEKKAGKAPIQAPKKMLDIELVAPAPAFAGRGGFGARGGAGRGRGGAPRGGAPRGGAPRGGAGRGGFGRGGQRHGGPNVNDKNAFPEL